MRYFFFYYVTFNRMTIFFLVHIDRKAKNKDTFVLCTYMYRRVIDLKYVFKKSRVILYNIHKIIKQLNHKHNYERIGL